MNKEQFQQSLVPITARNPHGRSYTQSLTQVTVDYSWLQARGQKHDQYSYSQLAELLSLQSFNCLTLEMS